MREIRTSGLMSGDRKRGAFCTLAPVLDSTQFQDSVSLQSVSYAVTLCRREDLPFLFFFSRVVPLDGSLCLYFLFFHGVPLDSRFHLYGLFLFFRLALNGRLGYLFGFLFVRVVGSAHGHPAAASADSADGHDR